MDDKPPIKAVGPETPSDTTALLVAVTRLEAKVDVALAQQGAKIREHDEQIDDHETRLRTVEAREVATPAQLADHEDRLRRQESRKTVSPKGLWSAVAGGAGVVATVLTVVDRLPHS